jgi:Protein of unknown function (DUF1275)
VQNAIGRLALADLATTTIMTVNVSQATVDALDIWLETSPHQDGAVRTRLRRLVPAITGFAVGTLAGAVGIVSYSFAVMAVPIAVILALVWLLSRRRTDPPHPSRANLILLRNDDDGPTRGRGGAIFPHRADQPGDIGSMHLQRCGPTAELGIAAASRFARIRCFDGVHDIFQFDPPPPMRRSVSNRSGESLTIIVKNSR